MKELTLLFLRKENQVLLAMKKRGFGEGRWNGVGGKLEEGETLETALIRESQEEIAITPLEYEKVADISFDQFFKGEPAHMHVHVFTATKWSGEPEESEEMMPQWFTLDALPYEHMWADDPFWLPLVLQGNLLQANFVLDKNDIITHHVIKEVEGFEE